MTTPEEPWTIGRLLSWTVDYLKRHGAENPRLDAEVLLAEARGCRRIDLYAAYGELANEETRTAFRELVRRRAAGTPVAYLVGRREFYAMDFEVTPDVLIPRPETELLVVALLDHVKRRRPSDAVIELADVGTGSGVLAVCAAKYVPNSRLMAIDISPAALAVARRNAAKHGVTDQIEFVEADVLSAVPAEPRFDYILSNPPYVSTAEMDQLAADVRDHEPPVALHAGERGTDVVAPLIEQAASRLKSDGVLLIEVSPMIAAEVEQLVRSQSNFELQPTLRDLAGHPRVVQAKVAGTLRVP
ncbi:MAG: peptide chain release factor N(5)-glutamine methyltransferase [Pirellulales bacterium]